MYNLLDPKPRASYTEQAMATTTVMTATEAARDARVADVQPWPVPAAAPAAADDRLEVLE